MTRFSDEELRRYGRQMLLPEVGGLGQERLRAARLTAESEVEALYLAGAGVGFLTVGLEIIAEAVRALNPLIEVRVIGDTGAAEDVGGASLRAVAKLKQVLAL